ncbi:hypothetical protein BKA70DRAFT_1336299 [Coprinopsis sp. MPI-PUGE-AT-0042]|nr:hypothetical protein BKA70DRAFT_1336299 [Coprinopsis sp. MPI-PUGE-AT-0042]
MCSMPFPIKYRSTSCPSWSIPAAEHRLAAPLLAMAEVLKAFLHKSYRPSISTIALYFGAVDPLHIGFQEQPQHFPRARSNIACDLLSITLLLLLTYPSVTLSLAPTGRGGFGEINDLHLCSTPFYPTSIEYVAKFSKWPPSPSHSTNGPNSGGFAVQWSAVTQSGGRQAFTDLDDSLCVREGGVREGRSAAL